MKTEAHFKIAKWLYDRSGRGQEALPFGAIRDYGCFPASNDSADQKGLEPRHPGCYESESATRICSANTGRKRCLSLVTSGATPSLICPLALALLVGCKGLPTPAEKAARSQAEQVSAEYRPRGEKPALPALTADSSLTNFVTFAVLNQPKVEAAYYDWLASIERITSARSLPDPQITFQMDIEDVVSSIMPGLMMNFPGAGKLRAGAAVASAQSDARYLAFRSAVLDTAFEVKRRYYQLYFLSEKIRVNRENLHLLSGLEAMARSQNEVGKVTLQDVLRAQIEQERVKNEIANFEDSRSSLLAEFKAALGLKANDPAPTMPSRFESTSFDLSGDKVFEAALAANTRLKGMTAEVRAAEASITLAHKAKMPDSSLGVMADVKMSPVLYRPLATITLPLWRDKIAAQIAEAQANKRSAEARLSAEEIGLAVDVASRTYVYRETSRNLALLTSQLLPKARQSLEVARTGYLSGQIDFFNLTDAQRTLLGFELERVETATQREITLAELSLIVEGMAPSGGRVETGTPGSGMRSSSSKANPSAMNSSMR